MNFDSVTEFERLSNYPIVNNVRKLTAYLADIDENRQSNPDTHLHEMHSAFDEYAAQTRKLLEKYGKATSEKEHNIEDVKKSLMRRFEILMGENFLQNGSPTVQEDELKSIQEKNINVPSETLSANSVTYDPNNNTQFIVNHSILPSYSPQTVLIKGLVDNQINAIDPSDNDPDEFYTILKFNKTDSNELDSTQERDQILIVKILSKSNNTNIFIDNSPFKLPSFPVSASPSPLSVLLKSNSTLDSLLSLLGVTFSSLLSLSNSSLSFLLSVMTPSFGLFLSLP